VINGLLVPANWAEGPELAGFPVEVDDPADLLDARGLWRN
jgi:hypothetical protein